MKDTTYSANSASNIHLDIDSDHLLSTQFYEKQNNSIFFHCELFIYMYILRYIPGVTWYVYLSVDIPEFVVSIKIALVEGAANMESTEPLVPSG